MTTIDYLTPKVLIVKDYKEVLFSMTRLIEIKRIFPMDIPTGPTSIFNINGVDCNIEEGAFQSLKESEKSSFEIAIHVRAL